MCWDHPGAVGTPGAGAGTRLGLFVFLGSAAALINLPSQESQLLPSALMNKPRHLISLFISFLLGN